MDKKGRLNAIINCCERRFERGPASGWKHSDFVDLNRDILRDTKVNISPNTLKRIFGKISVDDDYLPQQATIEALELFGGYSALEIAPVLPAQEISLAAEPVPTLITEPIAHPEVKRLISRKATLATTAALLVLLGLLIATFFRSESKPAGRITLTDTEGVLPSTAFFGLQPPAGGDSLFVDFGDKTAVSYVATDQKSIAHNYLYPGVFIVKLRTRQDTVSTTRVFVRSAGWLGLGFNRPQELPLHYYASPAGKTGPDSLFHIANGELFRTGVDTTGPFFLRPRPARCT